MRDRLAAERQQRVTAMARGPRGGRRTERPHRRDHRRAAQGRVTKAQAAMHRAARTDGARAQGMAGDDLIASTAPMRRCPRRSWKWPSTSRPRERGELVVAPTLLQFDRADQQRARQTRRTRTRRTRPGEPTGAGGVRRAGGAPQLPVHSARGCQGRSQGPTRRDRRRRRPHPAGVHRGLRRRRTGVLPRCSPHCSPAARDGCCSPTRATCSPPASRGEARPPGKKVRRLSLLSGGEKSLTAVAMLVAIFRARPSPFYVMDEVEAALDDVNLRHLIGLFEQLAQSQLIVITTRSRRWRSRTLYGSVSMQGGGITGDLPAHARGDIGRQRLRRLFCCWSPALRRRFWCWSPATPVLVLLVAGLTPAPPSL